MYYKIESDEMYGDQLLNHPDIKILRKTTMNETTLEEVLKKERSTTSENHNIQKTNKLNRAYKNIKQFFLTNGKKNG